MILLSSFLSIRNNLSLTEKNEFENTKLFLITNSRIIDNSYLKYNIPSESFENKLYVSKDCLKNILQIENNLIAVPVHVIDKVQIDYYEKYFNLFFFFKAYTKAFFNKHVSEGQTTIPSAQTTQRKVHPFGSLLDIVHIQKSICFPFIHIDIHEKERVKEVLVNFLGFRFENIEKPNQEYYVKK